MERLILPDNLTADQRLFYNGLMDSAAPLPVVLTSTPTTANKLLKEGQRGSHGGFIYETHNGVTYKYGVAV